MFSLGDPWQPAMKHETDSLGASCSDRDGIRTRYALAPGCRHGAGKVVSDSVSDSVLFVGTYDIPPGGVESFYSQIKAMNDVVRDEEPRVVFIGHYVNEDKSEGTSIHLHPDAESFDFHMSTATKTISAGTQTMRVRRIELYGKPSDAAVTQLSAAFDVRVKTWAGGLSRIDWI